jgi:hypothetical protein
MNEANPSQTQSALDNSLLLAISGLDSEFAALALKKGASRQLLAEKVDIMLRDGIARKNNDAITFALENNADPNIITNGFQAGSIYARNIELAFEKGLNPTQFLFTAVRARDLAAVALAVEKGHADVHAKQSERPLVFHVANIYNNNTRDDYNDNRIFRDIFDYLRENGMDINAQETTEQNTAVINASTMSTAPLLKFLLEQNGIDVAKENINGISGLKAVYDIQNLDQTTRQSLIKSCLEHMPDRESVLQEPMGVDELNRMKAEKAGQGGPGAQS